MSPYMNRIEAVDIPTLAFAEEHIEPILAGRKTATLRLDLDPPLRHGQRFQLVDEDGERFASSIVSDRGYESIDWIVKLGIDGHRDYDSEAELIEEMEQYYPDAELTPETCLDIVYWDWEDLWE